MITRCTHWKWNTGTVVYGGVDGEEVGKLQLLATTCTPCNLVTCNFCTFAQLAKIAQKLHKSKSFVVGSEKSICLPKKIDFLLVFWLYNIQCNRLIEKLF